ncbi:copper resistance CopC/CopD family protein [Actinophytocola sp.]|uniref:copper resistance CopC/CopD family protein n=1 Tax=Actinophytocola sp. TaxID=1872138 RepID=UPI002D724C87|nr:copper resistance protein CopC [Actinophytocola sp.]HYQ62038.1 copper resistance protein CopC [Actinophytocola sp.]
MDTRIRAALAVASMTVVLLLLSSGQAWAHAELIETTPANGAHLDTAPRQVVLRFTESVLPVRGGFRLLDDSGATIAEPAAHGVSGDATRVSMSLPANLGDGVYVVNWRVLSSDSHPVHGAFVFSVGDVRAAPLADAGAQAGSDRLVEAAFWLFRLLSFASLALLVGGASYVVVCWRPGLPDPRVRRLIASAWAASLVSAVALLLLQGPNAAGSSLASVVDPALLADTARTTFGILLLARITLLVLAGWLLARLSTVSRGTVVLMAVLGYSLTLTWSGTGHANAGLLSWFALLVDAAHLTAMAVWLGGLAVLASCTLAGRGRGREEEATAAVSRFSRTAGAAVAVLGATGLLQAWRELAEFGPGTEYLTLLIFKVAVFGLLLWLASLSRSFVRRRLSVPAPRRAADRLARQDVLARLRRSVAWEGGVAVVVLGITAALVAVPPGGHDHGPSAAAGPAGPFLSSLALPGSGDVQVWVDPARTGDNQIVLNVRDERGINRDVPEVRAQLRLREAGIDPVPLSLARTGPGQFVAADVVVPVAGNWTLDLHVRTTEFDEIAVDTRISMR